MEVETQDDGLESTIPYDFDRKRIACDKDVNGQPRVSTPAGYGRGYLCVVRKGNCGDVGDGIAKFDLCLEILGGGPFLGRVQRYEHL
jgi:hypothetical protein